MNEEQTQLIKDLEALSLYEAQNIPLYWPKSNGEKGSVRENLQYFFNIELIEWCKEGEKKYGTKQDMHLIYATIEALTVLIKDIQEKSLKARLIWGEDNLDKTEENFISLKADYEKVLQERIDSEDV